MRFATLSLFALLGMTTVAQAYDPYPFQRSDGKWGYVDDNHCWVISPQFEGAREFTEGIAAVRVGFGGKWGFVNSTGEFVIGPHYLQAYSFSEGLAAVIQDKNFGYIDKSGSFAISPQFTAAEKFSNGMAAVRIGGETVYGGSGYPYGYIDATGSMAINPRFYLAGPFSQGIAMVVNGDVTADYAYIDKAGDVLSNVGPHGSDAVLEGDAFSEGLAPIEVEGSDKGTLMGYINESGLLVIPPVFRFAQPFREGLAAVQINKKWGYINSSGQMVIAPKFDGAASFREGVANIRINDAEGYIDIVGHMSIDPQFYNASSFSGGRAKVQLSPSEDFRTIDHSGHILLDPTCDHTR